MELHLFEMHKQNLVYNLPIGKAKMDDRIEYALEIIEQRVVMIAEPDQPNDGDQEEENGDHLTLKGEYE